MRLPLLVNSNKVKNRPRLPFEKTKFEISFEVWNCSRQELRRRAQSTERMTKRTQSSSQWRFHFHHHHHNNHYHHHHPHHLDHYHIHCHDHHHHPHHHQRHHHHYHHHYHPHHHHHQHHHHHVGADEREGEGETRGVWADKVGRNFFIATILWWSVGVDKRGKNRKIGNNVVIVSKFFYSDFFLIVTWGHNW